MWSGLSGREEGGIANGRMLSSSAALDVVVVVVLTNVLWKMFH